MSRRFSGDASLAFKQLGWRHEAQPLTYFLRKYAERLGFLTVEHISKNVINLNRQGDEILRDTVADYKLKAG